MSLHRTRADWPIVAAAWLITLLAAILLSAGPIYSSAVSVAGLRRTLADAPVADANIEVSLRVHPADAAGTDAAVRPELQRVVAPLGGSIVREGRTDTFALPDQPAGEVRDLAVFGFLDAVADHATLVDGSWPQPASGPDAPLEIAVLDGAADPLGLAVGDQFQLTSRLDQSVVVPVRVAGIYAVDSASDPYWYDDAQLTTGLSESESYRTFGPFLTDPNDLLQRAGGASVRLAWRVFPDFGQLTVDDSGSLRARLAALPERLRIATAGAAPTVRTGLDGILTDAERSLLVSRTGVLLLMAQLAILAAYAIILTAALLVDHRRIDTALLRSRGAGPWQVALLAMAEGLMLAVPAVILAPWLAVAALRVLNVVGPLSDIGLDIAPRVTLDGYLAAAVAGIACVVLLVLPALFAARSFAAEQGGISRQETRTFGQRMGLDVALLGVTGIALWQLRLYGAPLTRTVQGTLGLDPLLVAAPAIGLLAGGVVALRVLPLLAQAVETVLSRGRDLVGSLGSRQLARRPLRYTRSALLLMLAMSMGVFALSYAATWSTSQRDQAEYQAGADIRVTPSRSLSGLPAWALPATYARLGGITAISAAERIPIRISRAAGSGDLLALDAKTAAQIVLLRDDEAGSTLADLMRPLADARPDPTLPDIPQGATYLRLVPQLDIRAARIATFDPETGTPSMADLDPAQVNAISAAGAAIIRDGDGLFYRVSTDPAPLDGPDGLVLPLEPTTGRSAAVVAQTGAHLDGRVQLAELSLDLQLPANVSVTDATVGIASVWAGTDPAGPWTQIPVTSIGAWSAKLSQGRQPLTTAPASRVRGTTLQLGGAGSQASLFGTGSAGPPAQLAFLPTSVAALDDPVPVIVNRAFLSATAAVPGHAVSVNVEGAVRRLQVSGMVDSFPTTDPGRPLIVMDEPTLGLLRLQGTNNAASADEWWMTTSDGQGETLAAALRAAPYASEAVVSLVDRTRSLSADPVALGIIGALTLGFVAAGLFAIVGLTVSAAVSARQRRTEFALLRALGLSGRQLSGWLWLENASLVVVSLLAGTSLGLLIGWVVLPFVTVTQQAAAPVPPVIVHLPWDRILLLEVVSAAALALAVVVIAGLLRRIGVGSILRMGED